MNFYIANLIKVCHYIDEISALIAIFPLLSAFSAQLSILGWQEIIGGAITINHGKKNTDLSNKEYCSI